MPNLHDAILEKYAKSQDDHILQYAFDHCKEAYLDILKKYDHDGFLRECPHEHQTYHPDTRQIECLDCGTFGTPLPPEANGNIIFIDGHDTK